MKNLKSYAIMAVLLTAVLALNASALDVRIEAEGGDDGFVYYYGQKVNLRVELSDPAYLMVYAINLKGDIRIVFPNPDIRSNYVDSGSVSLSSYSELLADMEGPLFMVALASENGRLNFGYQDRNVPLWSANWGEYHPLYSFISDTGFGRENSFPIVLAQASPRYYNKRLINDFEFSRIIDELNDKIEREYNRFDSIIEYFVSDLNDAVSRLNIEFASHTREFYIAGSRYNSELYDQRGTSVGTGSTYNYSDRGGYYEDSSAVNVNVSFDMHLNPYGHWVYIDGIRMWRPYVSFTWRPFVHGFWRWSIRGWLWICFSPWHFTYNYGYWYYDWGYGWVWIPDYTWHSAWVNFYYYQGYTGWRPAPLPHVYRSRVRDRGIPGHHNPYVFVSSRDFTAGDLAGRVLSDDVFSKKIKPVMSSADMMEFSEKEGPKFFEKITKEEKLSIKTADLEKTSLKTGDSKEFEALLPKLDSRDKETVQAKQKDILKSVETQKKAVPSAEKRISSGESGIIKRDSRRDSRIITGSVPQAVSREKDTSAIRRDESKKDSTIKRDTTKPADDKSGSSGIIRSESKDANRISIIDRERDITSRSSSTGSVKRDESSSGKGTVTRPSSSRPSVDRSRSTSTKPGTTKSTPSATRPKTDSKPSVTKPSSSSKSGTSSKSTSTKSKPKSTDSESSKSDSKDSDDSKKN